MMLVSFTGGIITPQSQRVKVVINGSKSTLYFLRKAPSFDTQLKGHLNINLYNEVTTSIISGQTVLLKKMLE